QTNEECISQDPPDIKDPKTLEICGKLVKYLKYKYAKENEEKLKDQHCNLLSLWIYEQLYEYFEQNQGKVNNAYTELMLKLSFVLRDLNIPDADNCLRLVNAHSYEMWKERKDLYDYCVDYDEFNKLTDFSDGKCKEYQKYINQKSSLHKQFRKLYIRAFENDVFYVKCSGYNPENMIPKLKCEIEKLLAQQQQNEFLHDRRLSDHTEFS
ncbi:hypothetical protein PCYB_003320, partial [Plasmodium cynomolgi strain B]